MKGKNFLKTLSDVKREKKSIGDLRFFPFPFYLPQKGKNWYFKVGRPWELNYESVMSVGVKNEWEKGKNEEKREKSGLRRQKPKIANFFTKMLITRDRVGEREKF